MGSPNNMISISNSKHIILIAYKDLITIELIEEARKVVTVTCEYNIFLFSRELGDLIKQPADGKFFNLLTLIPIALET